MSALIPSGNATGTGTMTLLAPPTNGTQTVTIPDATGTVMVSGNMPAFSYYLNTSQTGITAGTFTKILFDTQIFNATSSMFASSRFTPTVAGYYQINGNLNIGGTLTGSLLSIFKNGSRYTDGSFYNTVSANVLTVSGIVYCNGSTDYIELYGYLTGASLQFTASSVGSIFNGCMIRTA